LLYLVQPIIEKQMNYNNDEPLNDWDDQSEQNESTSEQSDNKPAGAYSVDDEDEVEEKDLKRTYLFGNAETAPVREGQPMGGESFGENNVTPSGDDENNPSRNAGYGNAFFGRTEPAEEHPENSNFTTDGENEHVEGTVDADGAQQEGESGPIELSDRERLGIDADDDKQ